LAAGYHRRFMKRQLRFRFWLELVIGLANLVLLAITILWKDWIEIVFNVDPDAGSGAVEWAIVAVTLLLSLAFLMLARGEWRRTATQPA
jgi:hypothetical protein